MRHSTPLFSTLVFAFLHLTTAQTTTSAPASSPFDANLAACTSYQSIQSSCAAATTGFAALPFSDEASCLCYTSTANWVPNRYDGIYASCANYYQTASPSIYSSSYTGEAATRTPCAAVGNVRGAGASTGVASVNFGSSLSAATMTSGSESAQASSTAATTTAASSNDGIVGGRVDLYVAAFAAIFALPMLY